MSLVNDMLKDLDRRRRLPGASASSYSREIDENDFLYGNKAKLLILAFAMLAGILAGYIFFIQPALNNSVNTTVNANLNAINDAPVFNNSEAEAIPNLGQEKSASISVVDITESGFLLGIRSNDTFTFEIVSRDNYGINVLLHEVQNIERNRINIGGFSLSESAAGMHIIIELNQRTDYLVYEEVNADVTGGTVLAIEATMRVEDQRLSTVEETVPAVTEITEQQANVDSNNPVPVAMESTATTLPGITAEVGKSTLVENQASIRTPRQLSLEELDINVSQRASQDVQRGQLVNAYQRLLTFIGENAEAHRSRETLATILFAQQEIQQANFVVDQGLEIAPNYAGYKKIKARLLMLESRSDEAVRLLRNLPPVLNNDPVYFELLASSYQQNSEHEDAIKIYQDLIRHDSQQARWWAGMAISHEALGNVDQAVSSFQAALQSSSLEPALRQYSQSRIRYLGN